SYIFKTTNANITGGLVHVYKTATSNDLCMDAGSATPAVGTPVRVQPCSPGNTQQKFSYNMNLTLQLTASVTAANALGMCLDAGVGAGAAGPSTGQIVNFNQFGRCIDVTDQNVSSTFLIVWPCKQAPNVASLTWNQRWTGPAIPGGLTSATGRISTTKSGTD